MMSNLEGVLLLVAIVAAIFGWINYLLANWKLGILLKLVKGLELHKKYPFLGDSIERLER
jgi:hypothetical protein